MDRPSAIHYSIVQTLVFRDLASLWVIASNTRRGGKESK